MKKQTRGRELALQYLYQTDLKGERDTATLAEFLSREERDGETARFARNLVKGVLKDIEQVDKAIEGAAINWEMKRMAAIDRNVLRIGAYELVLCDGIPPKVAINEAIELGKRYSTANSGSFINGILDKILKQINGEAESPDAKDGETTEATEATDDSAPSVDDANAPSVDDDSAQAGATAVGETPEEPSVPVASTADGEAHGEAVTDTEE